MKTFAKNLKRERLYNGFTQKQLAEVLGLNPRTYATYESLGTQNREPDLDMIVQMADILKTTTDALLRA